MHISEDEWARTSWASQRAILDFMAQAEDIPFSWAAESMPSDQGPTVRENVDAGVGVIDLIAMRDELEAQRAKRAGKVVTDV